MRSNPGPLARTTLPHGRKRAVPPPMPLELLTPIDLGGDGDCFFLCVAEAVGSTAERVRRKTVDAVVSMQHTSYFVGDELVDRNAYERHMRRSGTFAEGELEIIGVCNAFKRDVHVYTMSNTHTYTCPDPTVEPFHTPIRLLNLSQSHFQFLLPHTHTHTRNTGYSCRR